MVNIFPSLTTATTAPAMSPVCSAYGKYPSSQELTSSAVNATAAEAGVSPHAVIETLASAISAAVNFLIVCMEFPERLKVAVNADGQVRQASTSDSNSAPPRIGSATGK